MCQMLPLFAKLANEVFCQIAEGSFSDVSKPIFASKDAFAAAFGPLNLTKEVQEVALKSVREGRGGRRGRSGPASAAARGW